MIYGVFKTKIGKNNVTHDTQQTWPQPHALTPPGGWLRVDASDR